MPNRRYCDCSDHHKKKCRIPVASDIKKSSDSIGRGHTRECESKSEEDSRDERDEIGSFCHMCIRRKNV